MKVINRDRCVISNESDLEELINLKDFPVFIGATSEPYNRDKFYDMSWAISKKSGVIQLDRLLPLDLIYSGFHSEAVGSVWEKHRYEFTKFIKKNKIDGNILEMGGSDGKIASLFYEDTKAPTCDWTIIEPNIPDEQKKLNSNIKYIDGFIEDIVPDLNEIKNFVHSHVLEHLYNPRDIIDLIATKQKIGHRTIFAIPNLKLYLENLFVNALNFEHTYYITDEVVEYLFAKSGYNLVDKEFYSNHGIYYCFEKSNEDTHIPFLREEAYSENKIAYLHLINFYKKEVKDYNNIIDDHDGDVFLFGGHIFSQFLLYLGLKQDKIVCILDNSPQKQDKRLYGYNLLIKKPEFIKDSKKPLVILKVGQYFDEVKEQILSINPSIKIVK